MNGAIWIKLMTGLFDDEKIKIIENMPDGDGILIIWIKLLCLAGKQNSGGIFYLGDDVPMTEKDFAVVFGRPVGFIRKCFKLFSRFNMISAENGVYFLTNWDKYQQLSAYEKKKERDKIYQQTRRAEARAMKKEEANNEDEKTEDDEKADNDEENVLSHIAYDEEKGVSSNRRRQKSDASSDVVLQKREDKEKKREDISSSRAEPFDEEDFAREFYKACPFVSKIITLSDSRKKRISKLIGKFGRENVLECFNNISQSSFLSGKNDSGWRLSFDWIIDEKNFCKVLEGFYFENKEKKVSKGGLSTSERNRRLSELKASMEDSWAIIKSGLTDEQI